MESNAVKILICFLDITSASRYLDKNFWLKRQNFGRLRQISWHQNRRHFLSDIKKGWTEVFGLKVFQQCVKRSVFLTMVVNLFQTKV